MGIKRAVFLLLVIVLMTCLPALAVADFTLQGPAEAYRGDPVVYRLEWGSNPPLYDGAFDVSFDPNIQITHSGDCTPLGGNHFTCGSVPIDGPAGVFTFSGKISDHARNGTILHNYAKGWMLDIDHQSWSLTRSFDTIVAGIVQDPQIFISASPSTVHPGDEIDYTIRVKTNDAALYSGFIELIFDPAYITIKKTPGNCGFYGMMYHCEYGDEITDAGSWIFTGTVNADVPVGSSIETEVYGNIYSVDGQYTYTLSPAKVTTPVAGFAAPEFPSPAAPAILIAGFLGAVFLVRRTKED